VPMALPLVRAARHLSRAQPAGSALVAARPSLSRSPLLRTLSTSADPPPAEEKKAEAETAADPTEAAEEEATAEDGPSASELQARVEELEAQVTTKHEQALYAMAEAENARRRAALDVENAHKFAVGKFAKSLLGVADNLARAAESVPEEMRASDDQPQLKSLYEGVVMTEKTLVKALEEHGMQRLWPMDDKFDPNLHNALFEAPDPNREPGTVMHVASAGYVLHDRVIRAADVGIVSKPPS